MLKDESCIYYSSSFQHRSCVVWTWISTHVASSLGQICDSKSHIQVQRLVFAYNGDLHGGISLRGHTGHFVMDNLFSFPLPHHGRMMSNVVVITGHLSPIFKVCLLRLEFRAKSHYYQRSTAVLVFPNCVFRARHKLACRAYNIGK